MKKYLFLLLFCFPMIVNASDAEFSYSGANTVVEGENVTLSVNLNTDRESYGNQGIIKYDSSYLELVDTNKVNNLTGMYDEVTNCFMFYNSEFNSPLLGKNQLFLLTFKTLKSGNTSLEFENTKVSVNKTNEKANVLNSSFNLEIQEQIPITDISINETNINVNYNDTYQLVAGIYPSNTTDNKTVTWVSSNTNIATVDQNGLVKANKVGTATITAISSNGLRKDCIINVKAIPYNKITYGSIINREYTGKQIKPGITLKYKGITLKNNIDYTLSYGTNKAPGAATVKITFKGNYSGSKTVKFYIVPKKAVIKKLTTSSKKINIYWNTLTGVSGYQIGYRIKGTSKWTFVYVNKKYLNKSITKLTKNKTYEITIRGYVTSSNVKYFGAWSDRKTIKCR